jgi:hypothetical protein
MGLGDIPAWVALAVTVIINIVTVTIVIIRTRDRVDSQEKAIHVTEQQADQLRDKIQEILVVIEGFTREQSVLNVMNEKVTASLVSRVEQLARIQAEQTGTLTILNELLKKRGILQ